MVNDFSLKEEGINICLLIVFLLSLIHPIYSNVKLINIPLIPILTISALLTTAFISYIYNKNLRKYLKISFKENLFLSLNIFGLIALSSSIYSKYPSLTLSRSLQYIIVINCMYYVLGHIKNLKETFELISKLSIYFILIACAYALIISYFGDSSYLKGKKINYIEIFGFKFYQNIHGTRISSFMENPNILGFQLMVSILFCLYYIREYRSIWFTIIGAILLYTLILTQSRASLLGLIISSIFFIYYAYLASFRYRNLIITTALIGLFAVIVYFSVYPNSIEALYSIMGKRNSALSGREVAWSALLTQIKETPLMGIGYRISTEAILQENLISHIFHAHNLYLAILSEIGIIGLLAFLWIYLTPFIRYATQKNNKSKPNTLLLASLSILLAFLANQFFEEMFASREYPFMLTVLLLYIANQLLDDNKLAPPCPTK